MPASSRITPGNRPWTGAGAGPTAGLNRYRHCVGNVSLSDPGFLDTQKRILFSVLSFCLSVSAAIVWGMSASVIRIPGHKRGFRFRFCLSVRLCSHCVENISLSHLNSPRTQKGDSVFGSVCLCSYCVENVSLSDSDSRTQKRIPFLVLSVSVATMWRMSVSVVWTPGHKREFRFRFFNLSVSLCSET